MIDLKICHTLLAKHTEKTIEEIDEATAYDHLMNDFEYINDHENFEEDLEDIKMTEDEFFE